MKKTTHFLFGDRPSVSIGRGPLLTVQQVADHLQVSRSLIYKEIARGRLVVTRCGTAIRISVPDVERYVAGRSNEDVSATLKGADNW